MQILHVHSLNFDFRLTADFILKLWSALGYSRKNPNWGKEVEDTKIPGVLKKEHVEITEFNSKRSGIASSDQEKVMRNFHWSWFSAMEFPRGATQLCGIFSGQVLLSLEFPRGK